jgi:glycosyltransferase involved in cell wall biosynthesis
MKKVLIITYYWPPCGGAGVQRWLKFVKYLRDFGWEPIVYTAEGGEMPVVDESLAKDIPAGVEVIKHPIWEPYSIYKKFTGQKKEARLSTGFPTASVNKTFTQKLSVWLRGNLFIPDARMLWIKPSQKRLAKYLQHNKVDAIVSTGPPHSMHLIALKLQKQFNIPWLADFRDPWTNIDFYHELMLTPFADKMHKKLEQKVIRNADKLLVVGNTMKEEFEALSERKVDVITNGYDDADVSNAIVELDKQFSIAHIGTFAQSRNPEKLWECLSELVTENKEFAADLEIKLVGKVDGFVMADINKHNLIAYVNRIEYLPHSEVTQVQRQTQILLLMLNNTPNAKGILTGKFFEYMAAQRPVLCIGPVDGDAVVILKDSKAGEVFSFEDKTNLKTYLLKAYSAFKQNQLTVSSTGVEKYSRKALTKQLAILLNDMTK